MAFYIVTNLAELNYRLKDWAHPTSTRDHKPMHITGRYSWLGSMRDDFTHYATADEANTVIGELQERNPERRYFMREM